MPRILDEKGRLFGVLNIVDGAIVLIGILIVATLVRLNPIMKKNPVSVSGQWIRVEVVAFTLPHIADLVKVGDAAYDEWSTPDARIVRIIPQADKKYMQWYNYINDPSRRNPYVVPVLMELELLCTKGAVTEQWHYRRQRLLISTVGGIDFQSKTYNLACQIIKIKDKAVK